MGNRCHQDLGPKPAAPANKQSQGEAVANLLGHSSVAITRGCKPAEYPAILIELGMERPDGPSRYAAAVTRGIVAHVS